MHSGSDFPTHEPNNRRSSECLLVIEAELTFRGISRAIDSGAVNRTRIVSLFNQAFDLSPITAAVTAGRSFDFSLVHASDRPPVHGMVIAVHGRSDERLANPVPRVVSVPRLKSTEQQSSAQNRPSNVSIRIKTRNISVNCVVQRIGFSEAVSRAIDIEANARLKRSCRSEAISRAKDVKAVDRQRNCRHGIRPRNVSFGVADNGSGNGAAAKKL
jgi:hypothetical protein